MVTISDVADAVTDVDGRGALTGVDTVLADYLGSVGVGQVVLNIAALVKSHSSDAIFLTDPVIGDVGRGSYARSDIPGFFRDHVVAAVDIMTLNLFKLQHSVGHETGILSEVVETVRGLRDRGPEIVVVAPVVATDAPDGLLRMLTVGAGQTWLAEVPMLERSFTGSGDLTAAIFPVHWSRIKDLGETLGVAASVIYSILEQTSISEEAELQLMAAQGQVVNPVNRFTAHSL